MREKRKTFLNEAKLEWEIRKELFEDADDYVGRIGKFCRKINMLEKNM